MHATQVLAFITALVLRTYLPLDILVSARYLSQENGVKIVSLTNDLILFNSLNDDAKIIDDKESVFVGVVVKYQINI